ncbi:YMGG-like glycine zipper-containing protein [Fodinicurvata sp. EGI_FJ10296]|uniref:YMGG-like glycine zipper-containing protein n=1 Tax=Fodinicurvata sp. EGI_FJ10296 TaxID=3231908 RepID=UPI00345112F2
MTMRVKRNSVMGMAGLLTAAVVLAGCSGMTETEQRMLSGGAGGAAGGAAIGAITGGSATTGAIIGGAAGTAGGYLYDQSQRD